MAFLAGSATLGMKIRGTRECQSCGQRWSYYETGTPSCPSCGSLRSVGLDETRQVHTDTAPTLELAGIRQRLGDESIAAVSDELKTRLRSYIRKRGFISGGELQPLDSRYLAASELLHVTDLVARRRRPTEAEQLFVFALIEAAERGEWPPDDKIPHSLVSARGLGIAGALEAYRSELRTWLEEHPDPDVRSTLGSLRSQCKRAEALQGDIPPGTATGVVSAARGIGQYLRTDDEAALSAARDRLNRLE